MACHLGLLYYMCLVEWWLFKNTVYLTGHAPGGAICPRGHNCGAAQWPGRTVPYRKFQEPGESNCRFLVHHGLDNTNYHHSLCGKFETKCVLAAIKNPLNIVLPVNLILSKYSILMQKVVQFYVRCYVMHDAQTLKYSWIGLRVDDDEDEDEETEEDVFTGLMFNPYHG